MVGTPPAAPARIPAPAIPAIPAVPAVPGSLVPGPRRPAEAAGPGAWVRWYYESVLGWPTAPGTPVRLRTGVRFDVLDVPVQAGHAALRRLGPPGATPRRPGFPVALRGGRMLLLVAAGGAEELPGLLEWLEWGSLPLDLTAVGAGGLMEAPLLPATGATEAAGSAGATDATGSADVAGSVGAAGSADVGRAGRGSALPPPRPRDHDGRARRGAAVWLRPPEQEGGAETSLPALSAVGGTAAAPDLARLVHTLATECHRFRLSSRCASPRLARATR
ncbi:SCO3374 family protein [Streptomyces rochei]|uniref:SCO3374 family protein n=1 Tax=Streptomyces rochei TaxID=1928 RepID=UPI003787C5D2